MLKFLLISVLSTLLASSAFAVNLNNCTDAVIRGSIRSAKQELESARGCLNQDPVNWACYNVHMKEVQRYLDEAKNYFESSYNGQNIENNACFVQLKKEKNFLETRARIMRGISLKPPLHRIKGRKLEIMRVPGNGQTYDQTVGYRCPYHGCLASKTSLELIFHSDRGSQYCCHDFQNMLKQHHMVSSMSRKGDCWDNAVAESFFGTLKTEQVHGADYTTRDQAKGDNVDYIEMFYNSGRLHSYLGYMSPMAWEKRAALRKVA